MGNEVAMRSAEVAVAQKAMLGEGSLWFEPGGVLCMQFGEVRYATKPNRTARYLATARAAFAAAGIDDFPRHVLLATNPDYPLQISTLILGTKAFTEAQTDAFVRVATAVQAGVVRHVPGRDNGDAPPNAVITLSDAELAAYLDRYAYDISSVDLDEDAIAAADLVLLVTHQPGMDLDLVAGCARVIVDTRNAFAAYPRANVVKA